MRLLFLHGPAVSSSRQKLQKIKKEFQDGEVVVFGKEALEKEVLGSLLTVPLLSNKRLIIWENPSENFNPLSKLNLDDTTLVFWFNHEVDRKKPIIKLVQENKGELLFFEEAKEITAFPLLDLLANRDKKAFLEIRKLKLAGFDTQYFITMVLYLLRRLVLPTSKLSAFLKQRVENQKKNFSLKQLIELYEFVLNLDFKIKNGLLEKDQAEFLLIRKFTALG